MALAAVGKPELLIAYGGVVADVGHVVERIQGIDAQVGIDTLADAEGALPSRR